MEYLKIVKTICQIRGISIAKLESLSGLAGGSICKWDSSEPRASSVFSVSKVLEVPIDWIFNGIPENADFSKNTTSQEEPILNQDEQLLFKCFNETDYMGKARIIQCCLNEYDRVNK